MTTDLPAPVAAQALIQAAVALRAAIYLAVISLCLLLYDCAITIDQEVKFVWSQRWSFGKVVYIFIRYATILMMAGHVASMFLFRPSLPLCHAIEAVFVWSQVAIIIAGSSVLIVRTWLLWGGARWVLAALVGGLVLSSILSIYYVYDDSKNSVIIPSVNPQLFPGCLVRIPSTAWRPFVFPLIYETFIIILTVNKVSSTRNRAPLVMRLLLDGTLYYIAVAAVLLFTTIGAAFTQTRALVIGSGFHTACISIGCSRLVLSLHNWAHENKRGRTPHSSHTADTRKPHHSSKSSFSASFSKPSVPVQLEYELAPRTVSDIESAKMTISVAVNSNTSATALLPQTTVPNLCSTLPNIERPSLPERIFPKSSLTHIQPDQRRYRPPRSSSLYPARPTFGGSESREQLTCAPESEEVNHGTAVEGQRPTTFATQRRYNVI